MNWPHGARFAFTIVDDTEGATVANVRPIYELFAQLGIRTTKTVWVYPSRNRFGGQTLLDEQYREFILELQAQGFEIASHGVGSGKFCRREIAQGLDIFQEIVGHDPVLHANHSDNPDNIYWGGSRFSRPLAWLVDLFNRRRFHGTDSDSEQFWGDLCKERIEFIRNHVFNDIVTSKYDRIAPYRVRSKEAYSNYWFSSSDGHDVEGFNRLTSPRNVDRLVNSGGYSIVYTHFSNRFVDRSGNLDPTFESNMRYLASKPGWFVPASALLEHLMAGRTTPNYLTPLTSYRMDAQWVADRLAKWAGRESRRWARRWGVGATKGRTGSAPVGRATTGKLPGHEETGRAPKDRRPVGTRATQ